ncbi:MAG: hypothetical protein JSR81_04275 [Proteobacteria bacterium]|jgi:hypothetical protein|nr:hypothetical protein [Pseudomonadota bacterium]
MNFTSSRDAGPPPPAGGWEAYRMAAFAILERQESAQASKTAPRQEAGDAKRSH